MKKALFIIAIALVVISSRVLAQTEDDKKLLTAGPAMINPASNFSQWTVDYTYTTAPKPGLKNMRPARVVVTKTNEVRHEETTFENKLKAEVWRDGNVEVGRKPNSAKLETDITNPVIDFTELGWVSPKSFVGIITDGTRKFFAFKQDGYTDSTQPAGTVFATIDVTTRYPVSFRTATEIRQYTILPPPTTPLTVPADFAAAGKAMIEKIQQATPHLSAP